MSGNVWFISGGTSGFGKAIAQEAIARGDKVVLSSRKATTSPATRELAEQGAMLIDLDVTSDDATIQAAFQQAIDKFGRITHFINAPGYILSGPVESITREEALASLQVNVMGVMNMCRNEVAILRPQGHGTIANFGSIGSWTGGAAWAHYGASKWAVTGFTESLYEELKEFGIKVFVIEPGYFRTGFLNEGGGNSALAKNMMAKEYAGTQMEANVKMLATYNNQQPGDVEKGGKIAVDVLTGTGVAAGRDIPMRLLLGRDCVEGIKGKLAQTHALIKEWEPIWASTDHDDVKSG
ncbi:hypothetical protein F4778DRAFT_749088 [Xylariomycetidae sp. FL2044]|nr:hypothetical protein F4778DRAFT_749088 [Xylariomycetidae sp. FL2044]